MGSESKVLHVGSHNPGKVREYAHSLDARGWSFEGVGDASEPEEVGDSFSGISELKSRHYAAELGGLVVSEDAGLVVPSLGGLPGIYSARFCDCEIDTGAGIVTNYQASGRSREQKDEANNTRLLTLLQDMSDEERTAYFAVHISVARPCGAIVYSKEFRCEGRIVTEARGEEGFAYDCIFEATEASGMTFAELTCEQKFPFSHRGKGIRDLNQWLQTFEV
jgi:XTP/dITP diphosphohydrolase